MPFIKNVCKFLDAFAPTRLAEEWDNVGLLVGDSSAEVQRMMTCLTVTPESAAEAIERNVDLIVSHHPLPFRPLKRLTTDNTPSKLLWDLIRAGVAIYSPHTGFDSALNGINRLLAARLGLVDVRPLIPIIDDPESLGAGRIGNIAETSLQDLVTHVKQEFGIDGLHIVGDLQQPITCVAVACGSGGSFLDKARRAGADLLVTGETTFHTCLEASANNVSLILLGHFASERFAVEDLAVRLQEEFSDVEVWASQQESDPLRWV